MQSHVLRKAEVIWNYHKLNHDIFQSGFAANVDGILVFCSSDISVADEAANLWLTVVKERIKQEQSFPYLIFSGGIGTGPHSGSNLLGWDKPEADILAERTRLAITNQLGPTHHFKLRIFIEKEAANTGQNTDLTRKLIIKNYLKSDKLIIVQKPFMERRTFATFKCRWPQPEIKLYSSKSTLSDYPKHSKISLEEVIGIMLGDLQRIKFYAPPHGNFQIPQFIPEDVWNVYEYLTTNKEILRQFPQFRMNLLGGL